MRMRSCIRFETELSQDTDWHENKETGSENYLDFPDISTRQYSTIPDRLQFEMEPQCDQQEKYMFKNTIIFLTISLANS